MNDLKEFLDEKVEQYNQANFIESDPIQIPKQFSEKENIEIAGFLTATIAWGNRPAIIKNALRLMAMLDYQPYDFILNASESEIKHLQKFVHRTFNGNDCIYFMRALRNIYLAHGGLQKVFAKGYQQEESIKSALSHFYSIFFELEGERTRKHVSNVQKGASAKRLNMFSRLIKVA